jgi:hypothetical protein
VIVIGSDGMACSPEASVEMTVAKNSKFTKTRDDFSAIGALAAKKEKPLGEYFAGIPAVPFRRCGSRHHPRADLGWSTMKMTHYQVPTPA